MNATPEAQTLQRHLDRLEAALARLSDLLRPIKDDTKGDPFGERMHHAFKAGRHSA